MTSLGILFGLLLLPATVARAAQVGLLDAGKLPATGSEAARKVLDPAREPSNALIERAS